MTLAPALKLDDADRTVWFFGAGASKSAPYDVPLQAELLDRLASLNWSGPKSSRLDELRASVRDRCIAVQPGITTLSHFVLEEVFAAYELQATGARSTADEIASATDAIRELETAILAVTTALGRGDAHKWQPFNRAGTPSPYAELLEKLYPLGCIDARLLAHSLVTMNYDIDLDRCLLNMWETHLGDLDVDYGIDLANYRLANAMDFGRPRPRSVLLLRLHGSLNLFRCYSCYAVFTTVRKQVSAHDTEPCPACSHQRLDRIVVHPSYVRKYEDPVVQLIWGRLSQELINCDRWVFVGYSLPSADVHLRETLRHCLRVRDANGHSTAVWWAGRRDAQWDRDRRNYEALFGTRLTTWDASVAGFQDFVDRLQ